MNFSILNPPPPRTWVPLIVPPTTAQVPLRTVKGHRKKVHFSPDTCGPVLVETVIFCVFHTGHDRPEARLEAAKEFPGIIVDIYCHSIPSCTPQSRYHRFTKVAKNADIAKMAENCITCISTPPPAPTQTLWGWGPKTLFRLKIEKQRKVIRDFRPKKACVLIKT